jgi:hypothetical protein
MRQPPSREAAIAEVQQALAQPGCAVCHLTHRAVGRYLKSLAYEQVNDIELRAELRAARGFCTVHARRWVGEKGNVLGTALIYRDAITAAVRDLETSPARGMLDGLFGTRPAREAPCVACRAELDAQDRYLDGLVAGLGQPGLLAALQSSDGLCLPHTRRAVDRAGRRAEPVLVRAREVAAQLLLELDEVIRKEDYRYTDEPRTEAERTAGRRAVAWTAGLEN